MHLPDQPSNKFKPRKIILPTIVALVLAAVFYDLNALFMGIINIDNSPEYLDYGMRALHKTGVALIIVMVVTFIVAIMIKRYWNLPLVIFVFGIFSFFLTYHLYRNYSREIEFRASVPSIIKVSNSSDQPLYSTTGKLIGFELQQDIVFPLVHNYDLAPSVPFFPNTGDHYPAEGQYYFGTNLIKGSVTPQPLQLAANNIIFGGKYAAHQSYHFSSYFVPDFVSATFNSKGQLCLDTAQINDFNFIDKSTDPTLFNFKFQEVYPAEYYSAHTYNFKTILDNFKSAANSCLTPDLK